MNDQSNIAKSKNPLMGSMTTVFKMQVEHLSNIDFAEDTARNSHKPRRYLHIYQMKLKADQIYEDI